MIKLDEWLTAIMADPITKLPVTPEHFTKINGVPDARVFLKTTHGYNNWVEGQIEYEQYADGDKCTTEAYLKEIDYDRPVYEHFVLSGRVLDCGGGQLQCASSYLKVLSLSLLTHG